MSLISNCFTFQYVSINTLEPVQAHPEQLPLHSNMFLLIPNSLQIKATAESGFTFQYVSINTQCEVYRVAHYGTLHSNMFLLIPAVVASPLSFVPTLHSNMFLLIRS